MDAQQAFRVVASTALELSGDAKLDLLDACAALGPVVEMPGEAELLANIAANLRAADAGEQALLKLLEGAR